MDAESVNEHTKKFKHFGGIFKIDQLDRVKIISYPVALIIYQDNHWIAIYISEKVFEVCDSSGYLENENLDKKLRRMLKLHLQNKKFTATPRLQSEKSDNCALYCICYLYIRLKLKKSLCDFTSLFSTDKNKNSSIITGLYRDIKPLLF